MGTDLEVHHASTLNPRTSNFTPIACPLTAAMTMGPLPVTDSSAVYRVSTSAHVKKRPLEDKDESGMVSKPYKPRASRACESCHTRKVRCDVVAMSPCTNCQLDNIQCLERGRKPHDLHRRRKAGNYAETHNEPPSGQTFYVVPPTLPELTGTSKYKLPSFIQPLPERLVSSESDMDYIYTRGALSLPDESLEKELVQAYIGHIYPYMPSTDLHDLLQILDHRDGSAGCVSLFLYQAIMFAATAFVDNERLLEAGYTSRKEIRRGYFNKARVLHDFDCEPNRLVVVQCLVLMTYWHDAPDGQKDLWYWQDLALHAAHFIDLQRDPAKMGIDPALCKLRKRLWWSLFMRDRMMALCMRKPCRICEEDSDMPPLIESDFEIRPLSESNLAASPNRAMMPNNEIQGTMARLCIAQARLCVVVGHILRKQYTTSVLDTSQCGDVDVNLEHVCPRGDLGSLSRLQQELDSCAGELSTDCRYQPLVVTDKRRPASAVAIHRCVLALAHNTATLALYRPQMVSLLPDEPANRIMAAAHHTAQIAAELHLHDLDLFMPAVTVVLLLPAVATLLEYMSSEDIELRIWAGRPFFNCMRTIRTLRQAFYGADYLCLLVGAALVKMQITPSFYAADRDVAEMIETMRSAVPDAHPLVARANLLLRRKKSLSVASATAFATDAQMPGAALSMDWGTGEEAQSARGMAGQGWTDMDLEDLLIWPVDGTLEGWGENFV